MKRNKLDNINKNNFICIPFIETINENVFFIHPIKDNKKEKEKEFDLSNKNEKILSEKENPINSLQEHEEMKNIQKMIKSLKKKISLRLKKIDPLKYKGIYYII